jgi:transposase
VPLKSLEPQAMLSLHRVREGSFEERGSVISRIRGLLAEFDAVLPQKAITVRRLVPELLERLPPRAAAAIRGLYAHMLHRDIPDVTALRRNGWLTLCDEIAAAVIQPTRLAAVFSMTP